MERYRRLVIYGGGVVWHDTYMTKPKEKTKRTVDKVDDATVFGGFFLTLFIFIKSLFK